jgi:hypothetical protein
VVLAVQVVVELAVHLVPIVDQDKEVLMAQQTPVVAVAEIPVKVMDHLRMVVQEL